MRRPATVATAALAAVAVLYVVHALALGTAPRWNLVPYVALPAGAAVLTARGGRWTAAVAPALALAILSFVAAEVAFDLARPEDVGPLAWSVGLLGALGLALAASAAIALGRRTIAPATTAAGGALLAAALGRHGRAGAPAPPRGGPLARAPGGAGARRGAGHPLLPGGPDRAGGPAHGTAARQHGRRAA